MMIFLFFISIATLSCAGVFFFIRKKVVSIYRGAFFILLSGFYFSIVFYIAYLMRENFK